MVRNDQSLSVPPNPSSQGLGGASSLAVSSPLCGRRPRWEGEFTSRDDSARQAGRRPAGFIRLGTACLTIALAASGCAFVPKSRLDDAAKVTQTLRSENALLKDTALSLKGDNTDLTRRALDNGRKIATLEDANTRLETSVQAYIDEREDLNDAFQRFKRQAQASVVVPSSALQSRLKSFSNGHTGTSFDPESGLLSVEADRLFLPGTDRLRPEAAAWLDDCALILADPEAKGLPLTVTGHASESPVRLASTADPAPAPADLSLSRAVRIRDAIADRARRDPARIGVAALGTSRPVVSSGNDRDQSKGARIEINLSR